jgi:hypothetical protein
MTTSFNAGLFGKANISHKSIAVRSNSGVSNFGFRFSEENGLFSIQENNIAATDDEVWDEQIKADFLSGKFNQLIKKAREEFTQGKAIEI